jgi:hypothetical protein
MKLEDGVIADLIGLAFFAILVLSILIEWDVVWKLLKITDS